MASENEMGRIAALVQRKRVLREGMSLFEQEQRERRAAQGIRNEKRRGDDDELEVIAKLDREIREQIHHRDTANATGIQPNRWPSAYEFNAGLRKIQYHELNFHIAIVGGTGYGKSSLINAFLNLGPNDASAAPVGFPETTLGIRRYPDPGTQPPRPCTVWYEISGASVSHWDYFAKQALFVFDSIILTIGDRFQETDCQIIRSCLQFNIPCFLVRSKADWHIWNMMRDEDEGYQGPFNNGTLYQKCRQSFMDISQKMVTEELKRANLPDQVVYCVSNRVLRVVYKGFLEQSVVLDGDSHELALVKVLVKSINQRRGGSQGAWGKHTVRISQLTSRRPVRITDFTTLDVYAESRYL